ncbi:MAG: DUF368 domain-containing protein [Firmicutes bacterium]|nr:DUF368 domain-containing protein [Bacillota bacterium]
MKKKDTWLVTFIKGFIIGLGIIFPVSSSVLAIVMGIYKKILNVVNNIFKCFKKEWKFIVSLALGVVSSCIVSCLVLNFTLKKFPIATLLFFVGLIIGGIPMLVIKTKKDYRFSNIVFTLLGIVILIGISLASGGRYATITTNALGLLALFAVGVVGAGSMIVPGVSGSVMLVILGYYEPLLEVISSLVKFQNIATNILIVGVFGIGMLIGVVLFSKIMEYFLDNFEKKTYFAIIGFVCASVINVIISLFGYTFNIIEFIIGIVLFAVGFVISFKYLKEE